MELKVNKKYPCGYEWHVEYEGLRILIIKNLEGVCPLHGKKCKNGTNNKKRN